MSTNIFKAHILLPIYSPRTVRCPLPPHFLSRLHQHWMLPFFSILAYLLGKENICWFWFSFIWSFWYHILHNPFDKCLWKTWAHSVEPLALADGLKHMLQARWWWLQTLIETQKGSPGNSEPGHISFGIMMGVHAAQLETYSFWECNL